MQLCVLCVVGATILAATTALPPGIASPSHLSDGFPFVGDFFTNDIPEGQDDSLPTPEANKPSDIVGPPETQPLFPEPTQGDEQSNQGLSGQLDPNSITQSDTSGTAVMTDGADPNHDMGDLSTNLEGSAKAGIDLPTTVEENATPATTPNETGELWTGEAAGSEAALNEVSPSQLTPSTDSPPPNEALTTELHDTTDQPQPDQVQPSFADWAVTPDAQSTSSADGPVPDSSPQVPSGLEPALPQQVNTEPLAPEQPTANQPAAFVVNQPGLETATAEPLNVPASVAVTSDPPETTAVIFPTKPEAETPTPVQPSLTDPVATPPLRTDVPGPAPQQVPVASKSDSAWDSQQDTARIAALENELAALKHQLGAPTSPAIVTSTPARSVAPPSTPEVTLASSPFSVANNPPTPATGALEESAPLPILPQQSVDVAGGQQQPLQPLQPLQQPQQQPQQQPPQVQQPQAFPQQGSSGSSPLVVVVVNSAAPSVAPTTDYGAYTNTLPPAPAPAPVQSALQPNAAPVSATQAVPAPLAQPSTALPVLSESVDQQSVGVLAPTATSPSVETPLATDESIAAGVADPIGTTSSEQPLQPSANVESPVPESTETNDVVPSETYSTPSVVGDSYDQTKTPPDTATASQLSDLSAVASSSSVSGEATPETSLAHEAGAQNSTPPVALSSNGPQNDQPKAVAGEWAKGQGQSPFEDYYPPENMKQTHRKKPVLKPSTEIDLSRS